MENVIFDALSEIPFCFAVGESRVDILIAGLQDKQQQKTSKDHEEA
jgi:hypothetical protein